MGAMKYIKESFQKEFKGEKSEGTDYKALYRQRLIQFRKQEHTVERIEKPTNLARARELGYRAKKGILIARVKARKGSGAHRRPKSGRRPKRMGVRKLTRNKNIKSIAEGKAARKFPNCEVLNSYWAGEDGRHKYYEVILVDTSAPEILSDKELNWITKKKHRGRAHRGLTSAGKKGRGLRKKGKGTEKTRGKKKKAKKKKK